MLSTEVSNALSDIDKTLESAISAVSDAIDESTEATRIHGSGIQTCLIELTQVLQRLTDAAQGIQKNTKDIANAMNEKKRKQNFDEEK